MIHAWEENPGCPSCGLPTPGGRMGQNPLSPDLAETSCDSTGYLHLKWEKKSIYNQGMIRKWASRKLQSIWGLSTSSHSLFEREKEQRNRESTRNTSPTEMVSSHESELLLAPMKSVCLACFFYEIRFLHCSSLSARLHVLLANGVARG